MLKQSDMYYSAAVKCNDDLYVCGMEYNGLFRLNDSGTEFICFFPHADVGKRFLISDALAVGYKIFFASGSAEYIYIYDTVTGKFCEIPFELYENTDYDRLFKFVKIEKKANYI